MFHMIYKLMDHDGNDENPFGNHQWLWKIICHAIVYDDDDENACQFKTTHIEKYFPTHDSWWKWWKMQIERKQKHISYHDDGYWRRMNIKL